MTTLYELEKASGVLCFCRPGQVRAFCPYHDHRSGDELFKGFADLAREEAEAEADLKWDDEKAELQEQIEDLKAEAECARDEKKQAEDALADKNVELNALEDENTQLKEKVRLLEQLVGQLKSSKAA